MEPPDDGCLGIILVMGWALGMMIAVTVAWEATHSVLRTALYGLAGWIYVAIHFLA
jgi:hypothetical protein